MARKWNLLLMFLLTFLMGWSQEKRMLTGADQTVAWRSALKGKRVAILANPTSMIGQTPTVDSMLHAGIQVVKVFGPEHGFRGKASNGAVVSDARDAATGLPIISLYGKKSRPSREDLADVDIVVFDIQDVGARFYTYILSLQRLMQSCAENHKPLLVLDRPNPNGFYVDGPILEDSLRSGIGGQPIPIVHGMTVGEFAGMINGEGWLPGHAQCALSVIRVLNYSHDREYRLPVSPSPNLNTQQSVMLYPSLCLFEGTVISQGRGTQFPFTVLGAPGLQGQYSFSFKPESIPGMSETPLHQDSLCFGIDLRTYDTKQFHQTRQINLGWLIELYRAYPDRPRFFDRSQSSQMGNFDKLAGTTLLRRQIMAGTSEEEIRKSWEPGLSQFKTMRKKYLLYPDFN